MCVFKYNKKAFSRTIVTDSFVEDELIESIDGYSSEMDMDGNLFIDDDVETFDDKIKPMQAKVAVKDENTDFNPKAKEME